MRTLLATYGTRGDVQPFVALGKALRARGHDVVLCAPPGFRDLVDRHGVPFSPMNDALFEISEAVLQTTSRREKMRLMRGFGAAVRAALEDEWRAAEALRPDVIVHHAKALGSHHVAEKSGVVEVLAMPLPLTPTRAFPAPMVPDIGLGPWFNVASYRLVRLGSAMWADATNELRERTLGLPRLSRFADPMVREDGTPVPALYAYSEALLPRPADWPEHVHVTGAFHLDEGDTWQPPDALRAFLDDGPPPIFVGFGSLGAADAEARTRAVLEALSYTGDRAILATGWGAITSAPVGRDVFVLDAAPHDWLFPRMRAVVHHGGAGSTMAGLRAGKPTVICPSFGDQPFWGRVVARAGVGPAPIPLAALSPARLAAALRATRAKDMQARAEALGERMRAEDGTARAVAVLESLRRASR